MRLFKKFNIVCLFLAFLFSLVLINVKADDDKMLDYTYATYQETERITEKDYGYGIKYLKTKALSTAKRPTLLSESPEVINMVEVSPLQGARIAHYTYHNDKGWTKQTLSKMVTQFETNNPGWVVIAGVNGDFYDWKAQDFALPFHTTGTTVSDGEVFRAVESKSVGWTNNGTTNSFLYTNKLTFTNYHSLVIYDENGIEVAKYQIDKINEAPTGNELAVYYTYNVNKEDGSSSYDEVKVTTPSTNCYVVEKPIRILPTSEPELYAKGKISSLNGSQELLFGQFAIVTNNEEIKNQLTLDTMIRVQKDVTGEMANCDQIMGVGSTLVENGVISEDNSDGMRLDRHPRTCVGVKEDGTLMLFTIDGRQQDLGMYGMNQDELGTMMKYYGCYQGFNVDGGGSTTFGVRDENDNFVIVNSPSDGEERAVSDVILVVVPQLKISLSEYTDTSVKLTYGTLPNDIEIDNLKVSINDITKEMTTNEMVFDGLTPDTICNFHYSYDIIYKNNRNTITSATKQFKTGQVPPTINHLGYDIVDQKVIIEGEIVDENKLLSLVSITNNSNIKFIDDYEHFKATYNLNEITNFVFEIHLNYAVGSNPNRSTSLDQTILWYPNNLNINDYREAEIIKINEIIDETNNNILTTSKTNQIEQIITDAKAAIATLKTNDQYQVEEQRTNYINSLETLKTAKKYNNKNQEEVNNIIEQAIKDLQKATNISELDNIYNEAVNSVNMVKTKGCNNQKNVLIFVLVSALSVLFILIKRRH